MSVRQYIGARYVTKIYENTLDPSSAEWQASVNYEPLTLVTYNNGSYLSKKQVPASIGDPASNPTYWAQTGFYNGQISYLQSEIDALDLRVDALEDPTMKVLCIGDSYGVLTTDPWTSTLQSMLGLDAAHFTSTCYNGAGFVGNAVGHTFLDQAQSIADPETYTHVLVMGGFNDANADASGTYVLTEAAFVSTMNYIRSNFTNAKIYVGFMGYCSNKGASVSLQSTFLSNCNKAASQYELFCQRYHYCFISKLRYVLTLDQLFSNDVYYGEIFHPNVDGNNRLANVIYNALHGIDEDIVYRIGSQTLQYNTTLFDGGGIGIIGESCVNNGVFMFRHSESSRYISGNTTSTTIDRTAITAGIKIGVFDPGIIYYDGIDNIMTDFAYRVSGTIYYGTGLIYIKGKDVYFKALVDTFAGYIDSMSVDIPNICTTY